MNKEKRYQMASEVQNACNPVPVARLADAHGQVMDYLEKQPTIEVCDDCLLLAYDAGFQGYESQADAMITAGYTMEDHICSAIEDPEAVPVCQCSGHKRS